MSEIEKVETHSYKYGSNVINFRLRYSKRKTLGISVSPSCHVEVVAPHDTNIEKVLNVIEDRSSWIVKQLNYFNIDKQFKKAKFP